jgi:hypothetical protein
VKTTVAATRIAPVAKEVLSINDLRIVGAILNERRLERERARASLDRRNALPPFMRVRDNLTREPHSA